MTHLNFDDKLKQVDLGPIRYKLVNSEHGIGWTLEKVNEVEKQYRAYLTLVDRYPSEVLVPTRDIDEFWHTHILDTRKYANDCNLLFGKFLHHFPYLGLRGEEDVANWKNFISTTHSLFKDEFGIVLSQNEKSGLCQGEECGSDGSCGGNGCAVGGGFTAKAKGMQLDKRPSL
jgi:hypothetical protein